MKKIIILLAVAVCSTLNVMAQFVVSGQNNHIVGNKEVNGWYRIGFSYDDVNKVFLLGDGNIATIDSVVTLTTFKNVLPDKLDYKKTYEKEEVEHAYKSLEDAAGYALSGQFALRGGKYNQSPSSHVYEFQFALGADLYAQYGVTPHQFFPYSGIKQLSTYNISDRTYGGAMGSFMELKNRIDPLLNNPSADSIPELKAIYLLLYNYAAIEVCDIYGPFPYNEYKLVPYVGHYLDDSYIYNYDNVRSIYASAVADIDNIVQCLKHFQTKPESYREALEEVLLRHSQLLFTGSEKDDVADQWIRFSNSLKLRMAMHIVKADPATAQRWAEEAVAGGVIEQENQEVAFRPYMLGFNHPLVEISGSWNDWSMSASMESLLNSLNHPYIQLTEETKNGYLFAKNSADILNKKTGEVTAANTRIVGIRSGTHPGRDNNAENPYTAFSKLHPNYFFSAPLYVMKLSEVCFLRAEGAIRGWNMKGTAQEFYEKGIREADFEDRKDKFSGTDNRSQYDILVDSYMQLEHAKPYTYVDPTGDTEDIESVTKIGVKWNENDDLETKLEKIITQKYIAGFPYSFEAWTDLRRTGYPKLFEVLNASEADGSLKQGDIIRRLYFPDRNEPGVKRSIEATGLDALGGKDELGTRLWWDVDKPNF